MNIIRLFPVFLSSLLIAAHCLRWGSWVLTGVCLVFPVLLFFTKPWAARIVQLYLIIASLEWLRTLFVFASRRIAESMSWTRLAVILGGVAIFTAASGCVFLMKPLKERYKLK